MPMVIEVLCRGKVGAESLVEKVEQDVAADEGEGEGDGLKRPFLPRNYVVN